MNRLLMICVSKGRPDRIQTMIDSYRSTVKGTTNLLVCLDSEDERKGEYELDDMIVIERHPNWYTSVANEITSEFMPEYDYYGLVDDDYIFRTEGWDIKMVDRLINESNGWGISYANDLWADSSVVCRHPSVPIISKKMIDAVGYMIYPELHHFKIDTFMRDLVDPLGMLYFNEDVVIEHMHAVQGKAKNDDSYKWSYSIQEQRHGTTQFLLWKHLGLVRDQRKIKNAMKIEKEKGEG